VHAAVLGSPVAHSLSPVLHTTAYRALGLSGWSYHALSCDEAALPAVVSRLAASGRWAGLSLTMPLKTAAVPLCTSVTSELGAVNTLVFSAGEVVGHNTDVDGVLAGLRALGDAGVSLERVAMLGAGGTARAAVAAFAKAGIRELSVHVRSAARAADVLALAQGLGLSVSVGALAELPAGVPVVSTLPGAGGANVSVDAPLLDVVYAPWPTSLATGALAGGHAVVGGLVVLVGQAVRQVELMTGLPAPAAVVEAMTAAGEKALAER
jgi:shikimate dehydrogenase